MRTLITGGDGQLGRALHALCVRSGDADAPDLDRLDVTDEAAVRDYFDRNRPELVFHAAAWTDVDGCESDRDRAFAVNERGTRLVAEASARHDAKLVAVSTDFVFDGAKEGPYDEEDRPAPLSVYGRSKLAGEAAALTASPGAAVTRTAWLYGEGGGGNFVTAILAAAAAGKKLRVVDDQFGSPTYAVDVAAALVQIAALGGEGIFHVVNRGEASRLEFARAILDHSGREETPITAIGSGDLDMPAARPARSSLGGGRLAELGVEPLRPWREALVDYLARIGERRPPHV